jgi:homoserine O-acetyltransferase
MRAGSTPAGLRRRLGGLALFVATLCAAAASRAETQIYNLYDFQFEDGTTMPELRIAYETQGTLSPARDNAIVLLHDALADHHAFADWVGPGRLFDTNKYFVITADAIGGGESSSPSDEKGQEFPHYTIRDVMAAEYALVSRGLGVTRLRAIVGRSMGAFVGLEWAIHHPDMPRAVVLLAPSPYSDANFKLLVDLTMSAVTLDPDWDGGHYERNPVEGLRRAGMIYYPWSVSAAYLDQVPAATVARESEETAKSFAAWDANALMLRYAAMRGHDVTVPFGGSLDAALARAAMPVLLLESLSDRLIRPVGVRRLSAALPHASYAEIPGELGHRAITAAPGNPEAEFIERAIRAFLK